MTDERYTFVEDVREKKRTARGYHNKVRKGGAVKMPSDFMTRKEKRALNGEVKEYNLNKPMDWAEFKAMPDDLKIAYILRLRDNYGGTAREISRMLGVSTATFGRMMAELGIKFPHNITMRQRKAWDTFKGRNMEHEETQKTSPEEAQDATMETIKADSANIAMLLKLLCGTGAKLTIEVTL